jgi:hypothetical protein
MSGFPTCARAELICGWSYRLLHFSLSQGGRACHNVGTAGDGRRMGKGMRYILGKSMVILGEVYLYPPLLVSGGIWKAEGEVQYGGMIHPLYNVLV